MTTKDLHDYRAVEREPVCAPFIVYRVCTMAPPSFGGVKVLQLLQLVEFHAHGRFDFDDPAFVHLYAEAGKLAEADRRRYGGDPDFEYVPFRELASPAYARARARLIDLNHAKPDPQPGTPSGYAASLATEAFAEGEMTSQVAIVDKAGNALSLTTTINLDFGSRIMVGGFVLNNAMTVFMDSGNGTEPLANRMAPGKRPASTMAPTIVFDRDGRPVVVGGSAGGSVIPDYITTSLIEMLANGRTPAEALSRGHVGTATPRKLQLEAGTPAEKLAPDLRAMGHDVETTTLLSGLAFLKRQGDGWIGASDPRRDGVALGHSGDAR
jgi:gamma-glutamyltranspeptidase/glutathione hydrolase